MGTGKPFKVQRMIDLIRTTYFHGSKHNDLKTLDPIHSDHGQPFGQAIYLSGLEATARHYARFQGTVYRVKIKGNPALTLNLDGTFREQTVQAREALRTIATAVDANFNPRTSTLAARDLLGGKLPDDRPLMTARLLEAGVWMIYGMLGADEHSGSLDDGIQYAVLHRDHLEIIDAARNA